MAMRWIIAAIALFMASSVAYAQGVSGATFNAQVVSACGETTHTYSLGTFQPPTIDTNGNFCGSTSGASAGIVVIQPSTGTGDYMPVTVGTSDSTIVTSSTASKFLDIVNVSTNATICINFGSAATISGIQCAAGEYAIPPLWHRSWPDGGTFVPTDAIHAIASAASAQATVGVK